MYYELISQKFVEIFDHKPSILVRAPGRINLIGEHTDYNNGFVLPAAIDKAIYFAISTSSDQNCHIYSYDLVDCITVPLNNIKKSDKNWANFLIGVVAEIVKKGYQIPSGFNVVFGGDIPLGAGLSSSAAVESGIGFALNELFGLNISKLDLALIAQQAEHNFAGVNCGIMDMFASINGKENSVIKLDCRDYSYQYFPFITTEYTFVLCNTGVKHNLGDSEYNQRRLECEAGVNIIQQEYPEVKSLRDVSSIMLKSQTGKLPPIVYKRCKFIVEEIERVNIACEALQSNDLLAFGEMMYETHQGLSKEYEVSCPELDFLVEQTKVGVASKLQIEDVIGARMMGGGFGGCTLNLVKNEAVHQFISSMEMAYYQAFGIKMQSYFVKITNGVEMINI